MPTVFQGTCANCGHDAGRFGDVVLAVLIGSDQPPDASSHATLEPTLVDGSAAIKGMSLVPLPHPLESTTLEQIGLTSDEASRAGRLVKLRPVVCRGCGAVYQRRRLIFQVGVRGCAVGLAAVAIAGIGVGVWRASVEAGALTGVAMMVLYCVIATAIEWRMSFGFRSRAKALRRQRGCPKCGSRSRQSLLSCRRVPCPACGDRRVRFRIIARS